jgi:bifunctional DNA-binding transcriptional regulator/antitoxin component of YhaV-PrlF toxin-antitoxin module
MEPATMPQVKLQEKGQVTIPAELLLEWSRTHHVAVHDTLDVSLSNGVVMLIPSKRHTARRDFMSFAGVGRGLWGRSQEKMEAAIQDLRSSWIR